MTHPCTPAQSLRASCMLLSKTTARTLRPAARNTRTHASVPAIQFPAPDSLPPVAVRRPHTGLHIGGSTASAETRPLGTRSTATRHHRWPRCPVWHLMRDQTRWGSRRLRAISLPRRRRVGQSGICTRCLAGPWGLYGVELSHATRVRRLTDFYMSPMPICWPCSPVYSTLRASSHEKCWNMASSLLLPVSCWSSDQMPARSTWLTPPSYISSQVSLGARQPRIPVLQVGAR